MCKPELKHDFMVNSIYNNPSFIGIDESGLIYKQKEFEMYSGNSLVVKPDLYFSQSCGINHHYELKSKISRCCKRKARSQIERMFKWVEENNLEDSSIVGVIFPLNTKRKRYKVRRFEIGSKIDLD